MRFHFGSCRHDEAQTHWDDNCTLKDIIQAKDKEIFSLNEVFTVLSNNHKKLQDQLTQGATDYEKLKKQSHFAKEKIKHLQEVIDTMNKRSSFDDISVSLYEPLKKARKSA